MANGQLGSRIVITPPTITPPNPSLITALAQLVDAYSKLGVGDPVWDSVGNAIESLVRPICELQQLGESNG